MAYASEIVLAKCNARRGALGHCAEELCQNIYSRRWQLVAVQPSESG